MSNNVFVESSIHNFGWRSYKYLSEELKKVENPKYRFVEGDIFIDEDFDMRHIRAIIKGHDNYWKEENKYAKIDEMCSKCKGHATVIQPHNHIKLCQDCYDNL